MTSSVDGLVPTRFLCLVAHLIVTIMIFWVRDYNVRASLSSGYTTEEYNSKDTELVVGLSVALGLFLVEFIGFFGGITMFMHSQGLLSMAAHCSAAVSLTFFVYYQWNVQRYWFIFAFCSSVPGVMEIIVWIAIATHGAAAVTLTYFLFEQWHVTNYWWVFGFCSCLPGLVEIIVWIAVLGFKRGF